MTNEVFLRTHRDLHFKRPQALGIINIKSSVVTIFGLLVAALARDDALRMRQRPGHRIFKLNWFAHRIEAHGVFLGRGG